MVEDKERQEAKERTIVSSVYESKVGKERMNRVPSPSLTISWHGCGTRVSRCT